MAKNKDLIVGVSSIIIAIVVFAGSFGIPEMTKSGLGAGFFPKVTAVVLAALGVLILARRKPAAAKPASNTAKEPPVGMVGPVPVILNIVLFMVYLLFLEKVGFLIMTSLYMFLQILLLSEPAKIRIGRMLVISIAVVWAAQYLFVNFFQVMLPAGIFG